MTKLKSAQVVDELLGLYNELLVPFMKVRRDMPFPTEPDRDETDGEHAFSLAMIAMTLNERQNLKLDSGLIAKYALVHDLVEAHAGDISVRSPHWSTQIKTDREHEAYLIIKERFVEHAPWIPALIEDYEARKDPEAKFVYATDKIMGALVRMAGGGIRWAEYYPGMDGKTYHAVVARLRKKAEAFPQLLDLFDAIHHELDVRRIGYMKRG